ncbi:MAG: DUF4417 domain-containing protein [Eubacterium sp.]|nr:DUF4417 domain-containing protein [Eubacterium sp.]
MSQKNTKRIGCKDAWNAFMCEGATFSSNDIPFCPTTAKRIPSRIILWDEAKRLYKNARIRGDHSFYCDAFVCWYMDDYKFDGPRGIWHDCNYVLKVLSHFAGAISPDFSTYQDFPSPLKYYNTYRMRAFGFWLGKNGVSVINNVRWGTKETWSYCWDSIPKNSYVCIGTVGGSPRKLADRKRFEDGFYEMIRILQPQVILVYGSSNYPCFDRAREDGIIIKGYPSRTASAFDKRRRN